MTITSNISNKEMKDLLTEYEGLLRWIVDRYMSQAKIARIFDKDDLLAEARIGLLNAASTFDSEKAASMNTYVTVIVRRRLKDVIRKAGQINRKSGKAYAFTVSLHEPRQSTEGDESGYHLDLLESDGPHPSEEYDNTEDMALFMEAYRKLDPKSRTVLYQRIGEHKTLQEVGDGLGLCRERIRQLQNKALKEIRDFVKLKTRAA